MTTVGITVDQTFSGSLEVNRVESREFDRSDYGNRSILGPPFRIMDEGTTNPWGWIVNIISAGGAITGILAIFAWVKEDDFNPVLFGISAVVGILILIVLLNVHGTDGDEQVEHSREVLDVPVSEGLPHGEGITGDE